MKYLNKEKLLDYLDKRFYKAVIIDTGKELDRVVEKIERGEFDIGEKEKDVSFYDRDSFINTFKEKATLKEDVFLVYETKDKYIQFNIKDDSLYVESERGFLVAHLPTVINSPETIESKIVFENYFIPEGLITKEQYENLKKNIGKI